MKRVTDIGRQKDENEKRGYKSQSQTKKGGKGLQILEGKRTKMRKRVTNLNQGQNKEGKRVTNIGRQKDENEKRGYKSQCQTKKKSDL